MKASPGKKYKNEHRILLKDLLKGSPHAVTLLNGFFQHHGLTPPSQLGLIGVDLFGMEPGNGDHFQFSLAVGQERFKTIITSNRNRSDMEVVLVDRSLLIKNLSTEDGDAETEALVNYIESNCLTKPSVNSNSALFSAQQVAKPILVVYIHQQFQSPVNTGAIEARLCSQFNMAINVVNADLNKPSDIGQVWAALSKSVASQHDDDNKAGPLPEDPKPKRCSMM